MTNFYIATNGCGVLRHEANRIDTYLTYNGYVETTEPKAADIIIFVACGMTNEDVSFALEYIDTLISVKKENALFIVTGCLPAVENNIKQKNSSIIVYTYDELSNLDKLLDAKIMFDNVFYNVGLPEHLVWPQEPDSAETIEENKFIQKANELLPSSELERLYKYTTKREYIWNEEDIFQIRAAYGCSYACSYCSTRISVGKFRSIPIDSILVQYKLGLSKGYKRFMLVGTELGNYGHDIGTNIVELLLRLYHVESNVKIGIRYIHPDCLVRYFDGLSQLFENGFIYYFCAAIQTASAQLLKNMNRNPSLSKFVECIRNIHAKQFPVLIHSQVMVGFPGETSKDIVDTLSLLQLCQFDYVNVNIFSPRPMTPAAHLDGQIPDDIKFYRYNLMCDWLAHIRRAKLYENISKNI